MAAQVRVFVSHHHSANEDTFTARLVDDLEAAGADVWVDNERITSDDFIKKINEGLAGRQWLVLVMTPSALRSTWVQTEVNAALNQVRKGRMLSVIPIMAQPCDDADIPPLLDALHRYDATHAYEPARDGLLHALGLTVPRTSTTPPPSATLASTSERLPASQAERGQAEFAGETPGTAEARRSLASGPTDEPGTQLRTTSLDTWMREGDAYLESGRFEEALTAYEGALAIDGNSSLAWSGKAIALKQLGRYEEAGFAARCAQLGAVIARRQAEGR